MKITEILKRQSPLISFEFFPPKTDDGFKNLMETISSLKKINPSFVSMTYGAGGSTRSKTVELVRLIKNEVGIETLAHLTCVGHSSAELSSILEELTKANIENVLALRGDPPKGQNTFIPTEDGFQFANELVQFIKKKFNFCIGVAGYPEKHIESSSAEEDIKHLLGKVESGGDFVISQLFFDNKDFFSFSSQLKITGVPVIAGIMPITDFEQAQRFTAMCGAKIPPHLFQEMSRYSADKEKIIQIGIEHATRQCEELLASGVSGIHFYTLNKSLSTQEVFRRLKSKGVI
ncbi:MAG: methylenetetrahydrofolate reductase [NAD(P)H] [Elusimicrobiota bacterium]